MKFFKQFFHKHKDVSLFLIVVLLVALFATPAYYTVAQTPGPARTNPSVLYKSDGSEVTYFTSVAHDAAASTVNPLLMGCYSSAAVPTNVSADTDATRLWCLRSGALAVQNTFGGVLASTGVGAANTGTIRVAVAADANDAAITQNPILVGVEAISSQPTAATTGNQRRIIAALDGALYMRPGGPILWSCGLTAIGTTLTQCQAAPGASLKLYITDVVSQSNTSTAGLFTLRFGTGSNCVTGTGNLIFGSASALMASPANTVAVNHFHLTTPIAVTANNAICVLGVATNTTNIQINGYTAP